MTVISIAPETAAIERSRVLLMNGSHDDPRTSRMIGLSRELLEADGFQVDLLHQGSDVYEKWLFAHAVIVIAPAGASLIDARFKPAIERMANAGYPALSERAYGVVVHGDDADATRSALTGWFDALGMVDSDSFATLDRYLGYREASAGAGPQRKADADYEAEVRNVTRAVANAVTELRAGRLSPPERRALRSA
jgi:hypothetical protein